MMPTQVWVGTPRRCWSLDAPLDRFYVQENEDEIFLHQKMMSLIRIGIISLYTIDITAVLLGPQYPSYKRAT